MYPNHPEGAANPSTRRILLVRAGQFLLLIGMPVVALWLVHTFWIPGSFLYSENVMKHLGVAALLIGVSTAQLHNCMPCFLGGVLVCLGLGFGIRFFDIQTIALVAAGAGSIGASLNLASRFKSKFK